MEGLASEESVLNPSTLRSGNQNNTAVKKSSSEMCFTTDNFINFGGTENARVDLNGNNSERITPLDSRKRKYSSTTKNAITEHIGFPKDPKLHKNLNHTLIAENDLKELDYNLNERESTSVCSGLLTFEKELPNVGNKPEQSSNYTLTLNKEKLQDTAHLFSNPVEQVAPRKQSAIKLMGEKTSPANNNNKEHQQVSNTM